MNAPGQATLDADAGRAAKYEQSAPLSRLGPSLRSQVFGTVLLVNLVAAVAAGAGILWHARARIDREMRASVELVERFVRESSERLGSEVDGSRFEHWPVPGQDLRHVRIRVEHGNGRTTNLVSSKRQLGDVAPRWFTALVGVREIERDIPIVAQGNSVGRIVVTGTPSDEVAEIWEEGKNFLLIALGVDVAILLALYLALERVVAQLRFVGLGLGELEQGRFRYRMMPPAGRELAALAERFNALAGALDTAKKDNARLARELVSIQDEERNQIAADLHDELGPCLFGLEANAGSLERLVGEAPTPTTAKMQARIATIVEIVERMRVLNRRLLHRLRPVAIDHVPLTDLLKNLVAEFERHAPERQFDLDLGRLAPRYGDCIDLTVYRCIQEGVTNALKHGDARAVRIELHDVTRADGRRLYLCIEDDGHGLPAEPSLGMGLIGMRDRVRALGGQCRIAAAGRKGARISVDIPIGSDHHDITHS